MAPGAPVGTPRCFMFHGRLDRVLPIEQCSRRIVPQLQRAGYDVLDREFDGSHTVPEAIAPRYGVTRSGKPIAREGVTWFTA